KIEFLFLLWQGRVKMTEKEKILEGQLRECYGRVVYSHKTHEKCADTLLKRQSCIKIFQIAISALVTGGILSIFLGTKVWSTTISAALSAGLFALNAYTKDYDLGTIAQKHRQAASDIWIIRERYLSLLTDVRTGDVEIESIRAQRDALAEELYSVYVGAPSTN